MKILIIKRDKIGDMLLTTPMLAHLRTALPDAEIHVLANTYSAWVLDGNADVDQVWRYRRVRQGGRLDWAAAFAQLRQLIALRMQRYDVAIVAGGEYSKRALRRALAVRARRVIAHAEGGQTVSGLSDPVSAPGDEMHEVERMIELLRPLGVALPTAAPEPRYTLPDESRSTTTAWLHERGLAAGRYLVIGLGARRAKRQPSAAQVLRWGEWAWRERGLATVFMWTPGRSDNPDYPGDDDIAQPVLDAAPEWLHPFRGPLAPAIGLIWMARSSLIPDSGLMHFAAASPGGVLGLFAEPAVSPPPQRWGPRGTRARWLAAPRSVTELDDAEVLTPLADRIDSSGADAGSQEESS